MITPMPETACTLPTDILETLLALAMQGGWAEIETAPKDGTNILVYADIATVPVVHIAWFRSEAEWLESGQYCGGWDTLDDWLGWWSYTRNSVTQEKLEGYAEPTHWMPFKPPSPDDALGREAIKVVDRELRQVREMGERRG